MTGHYSSHTRRAMRSFEVFLVVDMNKLLMIGDVMTLMWCHHNWYDERSGSVARFVSVNQLLSLIYDGNALFYYTLHGEGHKIDGLVQERRNSIAIALELRLSCTKPSKCHPHGHARTAIMKQDPSEAFANKVLTNLCNSFTSLAPNL